LPLSDLVGWFAGRSEGDKRTHERIKKGYKAAFTMDGTTWEPAIGVDLSDEGMCIMVQREIEEDKPFSVRATLDTRVVNMACVKVWNSRMSHNGRPVQCYGLKFVNIAADDWDLVVKFISGEQTEEKKEPEAAQPSKQAATASAPAPAKDDDVGKHLPKELKERFYLELVRRHRLAAPEEGQDPQVRYEYGGVSEWRGKNMHRVTIHSTFVGFDKRKQRFSTRFMFDEKGREVIVLN